MRNKTGRRASYGVYVILTERIAALMHPIPYPPLPDIDPALLKALCAFADELSHLPDPRGVRDPLAVLLGTLLVALAGGANTIAAVAEFTDDHQAWFRQWLPLGRTVPTDDTYRLLVRRLEPETAVKAALLLLDGTCLPGLQELILALDGKFARRSGDRAAGTRPLLLVSAFLVREGLTLAQEPCEAKSNEITAIPRLLERMVLEGGRRHDRRRRLPAGHRASPASRRCRLRPGRQAQPAHPACRGARRLRGGRAGRLHARGAGRVRDRRAQRRAPRTAHLHGPGRAPASANGWPTPPTGPACAA